MVRLDREKQGCNHKDFQKGSMEWMVRVLKEASQTKGNYVRRWRKTDDIAVFLVGTILSMGGTSV